MDRTALAHEIPRLRRYARALAGDVASADDLVQDTLQRALEKGSQWRQASNLTAWLMTLMHNLFVNQARSARARYETAWDESTEMQTESPSQSDPFTLRDLQRGLLQLPLEQREALLLVGLEEFSYQETAAILGVPVGTVMSRLSRAREHLRALLNGEAPAATHLKVVK